jgi:hypothetical protein
MKKYIQKVTDKIESFTKGKNNQKSGTFSQPRQKATNDLFTDFFNLFQLQGIQTICNSHSELIKAYQAKISELKQEVQQMAESRKGVIREEQNKFMDAKRQGIRALINYKLSKQKFREKMTKIEKQFASDFHRYSCQAAEEAAFIKLKEMEEHKRSSGYMYVRNDATKNTKIIGAGVNLDFSKQQIEKLTRMQNILNQMITKLSPKDHDIACNLLDEYVEISYKERYDWDLADIECIRDPNTDMSKKKQQIGYQQSVIRMEMKHWKLQKGMNANILYSS